MPQSPNPWPSQQPSTPLELPLWWYPPPFFPTATPVLRINGAAVAAPKEVVDHLDHTFAAVPNSETTWAILNPLDGFLQLREHGIKLRFLFYNQGIGCKFMAVWKRLSWAL